MAPASDDRQNRRIWGTRGAERGMQGRQGTQGGGEGGSRGQAGERPGDLLAGGWWKSRTSGWIGGVGGLLVGLLGAFIGWAAARGNCPGVAIVCAWVLVGVGAAALAVGAAALSLGQPFSVWFVPCLLGLVAIVVGVAILPILRSLLSGLRKTCKHLPVPILPASLRSRDRAAIPAKESRLDIIASSVCGDKCLRNNKLRRSRERSRERTPLARTVRYPTGRGGVP